MSDRHISLTPEELSQYYVVEDTRPVYKPREKTVRDTGVIRDIQAKLDLLQQALDQRAKEFGVTAPKLERPILPKEFTSAHLEAIQELFGTDTIEPFVLPRPDQITDEYMDIMFPATQPEADKVRGLVSYRPVWWNREADKDVVGPVTETLGSAYLRSFRGEAAELQGALVLTESITKPRYENDRQYGSVEGMDDTLDSLLPLIREVFGPSANRFNLSWDQITTELIPVVKDKISSTFTAKGLSMPNFEVILNPALANNLQMTLNHPENSSTNTCEWSNTTLLKQDGSDSGPRLLAGYSVDGGAAFVGSYVRLAQWSGLGFRLSVVLRPDTDL